jgi:hypothetical protein
MKMLSQRQQVVVSSPARALGFGIFCICILGFALAAASPAPAATDNAARQAMPVQLGTSGGNTQDGTRQLCCSGTLGALIRLNDVPQVLSNNHVLARSGLAGPGETVTQPGLVDTNCSARPARAVAVFRRDWVPLGSGNVDVAVARVVHGKVDASGAILGLGVPCTDMLAPAAGLAVQKSGRTSGVTTGTIQAIDAEVTVDYQQGCATGPYTAHRFEHQVVIGPQDFSVAGDSGSLILSTDMRPVGLLFAGSGTVTLAHPIQDVANAFESAGLSFALVGADCSGGASGTGAAAAPSAATATPAPGVGPAPAAVAQASAVKTRHRDALFAQAGVLGVGVGRSDDDPAAAAIVVFVDEAVAARPALPAQLEGVKVRVVPTGRFVAR